MLPLFLLVPALTKAQTDKKEAELKKLETSLSAAKAKVTLNERQLAVSDSLITLGNQMIAESKTSKDKDEALKARADLKALDIQYKSDSKALSIRLKDATKKMSTGNANLTRGKAGKKNAQDALKISRKTLETAQEKYDNASASGDSSTSKEKKKK